MSPPHRAGYTLVELMILVVLIGILVMIAVPKIGAAITKANESATRAKLAALRKALELYQADHDGIFPNDISVFTQPGNQYLQGDIMLNTSAHGARAAAAGPEPG